jgi:hypothetical protein
VATTRIRLAGDTPVPATAPLTRLKFVDSLGQPEREFELANTSQTLKTDGKWNTVSQGLDVIITIRRNEDKIENTPRIVGEMAERLLSKRH